MLSIYSHMMRGLSGMDKYIVANVNMFSRKNQVVIIDSEVLTFDQNYSLEQLPEIILQLAYENNIYNVKLAGAGKFAQLIEYEINSKEITKYNENKIEVEVI